MKSPHRARLLTLLLAGIALGAMAAGCKRAPAPATQESEQPATAPEAPGFVVAFLYGGPVDDAGFNSAHRAGANAVAALPGVKVIEEEGVPEDARAATLMEKTVLLRGASLVFATAYGHFAPMLVQEAAKHPKVPFLHCGAIYQEGKHPPNTGSYYGYLDESFYVAGVTAGLTTRTKKLGFVAGRSLSHVLREINAFTLGARSVNPKVTTTVIFTGSWSDAAAEERAANQLADQKIDVLAMHVNAPRTLLETAERRGIYSVGVHVDGSRFAPRGYLTGAESSWQRIYTDYVRAIVDGKPYPHMLRGGLGDGYVSISPFGPAVPEAARQKALEARAQLADGTLLIFKGPLKDNKGKLVMPAGKELIQKDVQLELMPYLVEGVIGTLPE
jgi:simple sugar transport system substrate-binding protein